MIIKLNLTAAEAIWLQRNTRIMDEINVAADAKATIVTTLASFRGQADILHLALRYAKQKKVEILFKP